MELTVSGRHRRAAQAAGTAPKAEKQSPAAGNAAVPKALTDKTAWSQAALSFLQAAGRQDMERQRELLEAKQRRNGDLDVLTKSLETMEKCRKIASRIMKGDRVPPQDELFLMEADPDGYRLAIACRVPKEKPKEWESVLEEEDREDGSAGFAESGEASAGAPESGGETAEC